MLTSSDVLQENDDDHKFLQEDSDLLGTIANLQDDNKIMHSVRQSARPQSAGHIMNSAFGHIQKGLRLGRSLFRSKLKLGGLKFGRKLKFGGRRFGRGVRRGGRRFGRRLRGGRRRFGRRLRGSRRKEIWTSSERRRKEI